MKQNSRELLFDIAITDHEEGYQYNRASTENISQSLFNHQQNSDMLQYHYD